MLATTTVETPPLPTLEFLHRIFDTLEGYFTTVEERTIKDNFATVYQILEEMVDFGYPLTTEPNALHAMIKPPSLVGRISQAMGGANENISDILPSGTISNMPWRQSGVHYTNNEIYLDLVEEVDCLLTVDGLIISSEVSGKILGNSKLSGVPDLTLQVRAHLWVVCVCVCMRFSLCVCVCVYVCVCVCVCVRMLRGCWGV